MRYFQPVVRNASGHQPSAYLPPDAAIIKLNSNENPYPPSPEALRVLREIDGEWLRRYPDPYGQEFCRTAAAILGVPSDWIIAGNGGDDVLSMVIRACTDGTRPVVYPTPTYGLYHTLGEIHGAQTVEIPYPPQLSLPVDQIVEARGALTLIASPNSPSGHQTAMAELQTLAERVQGVLVIDEAYVDFAGGSALELVQDYEHVMVLRTLSKGYSLAGLRFGFGIAQPPLLSGLFKVKDSYGVDAIATRVATAAMTDQRYKDQRVAQIRIDRQTLTANLTRLGCQVLPSHGNFVLATHIEAKQLYEQLKANNIWVRHYEHPDLYDKLRITVGTPTQNQKLLETMSALLRGLNENASQAKTGIGQ